MISLDISDTVRLFDSMVLPIVCYRSEVWGFHKVVDIERVLTKCYCFFSIYFIITVRTTTVLHTVYCWMKAPINHTDYWYLYITTVVWNITYFEAVFCLI